MIKKILKSGKFFSTAIGFVYMLQSNAIPMANDGPIEIGLWSSSTSTAVSAGHAVSSVVLAFNNMGEPAWNKMHEILNGPGTNEEKSMLLQNNSLTASYFNIQSSNIQNLVASNFDNIQPNTPEWNIYINTISNDFGWGDVGGIPNIDPCYAYKQGQADCLLGLNLCLCAAAGLCATTTVGWLVCFSEGASICSGLAAGCGASNNAAYPKCAENAGSINWAPYLTASQTNSGGGVNGN